MEVLIPNIESSPYLISPYTPKHFGEFYFSAPTSPRLISEFYQDFDDFSVSSSVSTIPFDWEEKPGTPKSPNSKTDFTFDLSEVSEKTTLPAEELFDGGKIRPLKPPPFSPRKKKEFDIEKTEQNRGRERVSNSLPTSRSGRRGTRSQSPYRVSKYPWEDKEVEQEEEEEEEEKKLKQSTKQSCSVFSKPTLSSTFSNLFSSSPKSSRKWKLKDFFLFRSASEGRAADKDPLKKYCALFKKNEDVKNTSFRSVEGSNSGKKRRGRVSAHELHYTVNRAVSEDLKKKTFLPYKQGILGKLSFNPAVHALANGFGFSRK